MIETATSACVYDVELAQVRDPFNYWYTNSRPSFDLVLRNTGTCPWPANTTLALVSENRLDWPEDWPVQSANVEQTVEVAVQLTAPDSPQSLLIAWQLRGPDGQLIGSEITRTLRIEQRATATPTAVATEPPPPASTQLPGPPPPTLQPPTSQPPTSPPPTPTREPPPQPSPTR